ncbi:MAG: KH domain-containing protein [Clostridiales bacterium]|nr:KH domain-containing protein [Clostridiales bacterium]
MNNNPEVLKVVEATGTTITAAIEAALKKINKDRDDVTVEILEKPRSGFLGIGASPARVAVSYYEKEEIVKPQQQPKPVQHIQTQPQQKIQPKAPQIQQPKPAVTAPVANTANQAPKIQPAQEKKQTTYYPATSEASQRAKEFVEGLLKHYGITAEIDVKEDNEYNIAMELRGDYMGVIIGRRGDTLDAIQYLCSLVVNRKEDKHYRIILDTENYRAKREESLERLAKKIAGKVLKYKKSMTLEPMNPYERRIIHSALQDFRGITTYSTGNEPNRRIVVTLAGSQKNGGQSVRRYNN